MSNKQANSLANTANIFSANRTHACAPNTGIMITVSLVDWWEKSASLRAVFGSVFAGSLTIYFRIFLSSF